MDAANSRATIGGAVVELSSSCPSTNKRLCSCKIRKETSKTVVTGERKVSRDRQTAFFNALYALLDLGVCAKMFCQLQAVLRIRCFGPSRCFWPGQLLVTERLLTPFVCTLINARVLCQASSLASAS